MFEFTVPIEIYEARVSIERGNPVGYPASAMLFDDSADVVAETRTRVFNGYCHACICALLISSMVAALDADDACEYVAAADIYCECDD